MVLENKRSESSFQSMTMEKDVCVPTTCEDASSDKFDDHGHPNQNGSYFIAKVKPLIILTIHKLLPMIYSCFMEIA